MEDQFEKRHEAKGSRHNTRADRNYPDVPPLIAEHKREVRHLRTLSFSRVRLVDFRIVDSLQWVARLKQKKQINSDTVATAAHNDAILKETLGARGIKYRLLNDSHNNGNSGPGVYVASDGLLEIRPRLKNWVSGNWRETVTVLPVTTQSVLIVMENRSTPVRIAWWSIVS